MKRLKYLARVVQQLGLRAFRADSESSIFGRETKIPQAKWHSQKKKKKKELKINK